MDIETREYLEGQLRLTADLRRFLPDLDAPIDEFWRDVLARFLRGESADAITAIERQFVPKWLSRRVSRLAWEQADWASQPLAVAA